MIYDYQFFLRRYDQIENDFLEITDFIELRDDFESPCFKIGSSRLMDFCLKVGTEVETLFKEILESHRFDSISNIQNKRKDQNIDCYREIIEPVYELGNYELYANSIRKTIKPFEGFNSNNPEWFGIYSKHKHNKLQLMQLWNLRHSLFALGCLLILVINHPSLDGKEFRRHLVSQRVFDLLLSKPKFVGTYVNVSY
jgi:hypothetical protein